MPAHSMPSTRGPSAHQTLSQLAVVSLGALTEAAGKGALLQPCLQLRLLRDPGSLTFQQQVTAATGSVTWGQLQLPHEIINHSLISLGHSGAHTSILLAADPMPHYCDLAALGPRARIGGCYFLLCRTTSLLHSGSIQALLWRI